MADRGTIKQVMIILSAAYPRFTVTADTGRVYADLLADIDDDLLIAATKQHATSSKWFPSVAELRQAAFNIRAKSRGIPSPAEAWGEVMREVRRVGSWGTPEFSTPLIADTVDGLGGWAALCASDNNVADRAHFLKIYGSLLERHDQDAAMLPEIRDLVAQMSARMEAPQLEEGR